MKKKSEPESSSDFFYLRILGFILEKYYARKLNKGLVYEFTSCINYFSSDDEIHSFDEKRYITIGESVAGRLLLVCHTIGKENVRIISARKPTRGERKDYEHG